MPTIDPGRSIDAGIDWMLATPTPRSDPADHSQPLWTHQRLKPHPSPLPSLHAQVCRIATSHPSPALLLSVYNLHRLRCPAGALHDAPACALRRPRRGPQDAAAPHRTGAAGYAAVPVPVLACLPSQCPSAAQPRHAPATAWTRSLPSLDLLSFWFLKVAHAAFYQRLHPRALESSQCRMGPRPTAHSGGARSRGEIDSRRGRVGTGQFWARATRSRVVIYSISDRDGWADEDLIQTKFVG